MCSSVLAACGGGDDTSSSTPVVTTDVADKYVGTWVGCGAEGADSGRVVLTASKTSATSISYTVTTTLHTGSTTCGGVGTPNYNERGTIVYRGTKVIGSDTVDLGEGTVTFDNDPSDSEPRVEKDISLVSGNTIYFGDDTALDVNGYPTAIDRTFFVTKQ